MKAAFLPDRGVVKVSGEDARNFLNGLVTTDVTLLRPGLGRFGALLTPQGKITVDFLITEAPAGHGGGFLIDARAPLAQGACRQARFLQAARQGGGGKPLGQPRRAGGMGRRARDEARSGLCRSAQRCARLAHPRARGTQAEGRRPHRRGTRRQRGLRRASHRYRRSARRPRFHVWRRVSARDQYGPPARRRFRQGLLCRPGGGVADAASRHRAHPDGAGHSGGLFAGSRARRFWPATSRSAPWVRPPRQAVSR